MDTPLIISCGATLAAIVDRLGKRPFFEKLRPHDPIGPYGSYLVIVDEELAETILRRYPWVARLA